MLSLFNCFLGSGPAWRHDCQQPAAVDGWACTRSVAVHRAEGYLYTLRPTRRAAAPGTGLPRTLQILNTHTLREHTRPRAQCWQITAREPQHLSSGMTLLRPRETRLCVSCPVSLKRKECECVQARGLHPCWCPRQTLLPSVKRIWAEEALNWEKTQIIELVKSCQCECNMYFP